MSTTTTSISLAQFRPIPRTLAPFPAIVGFYFSFRLLAVLIAVRIFRADPQAGVLVSLGLNFILFGLAAFDAMGPGLRTFSIFCIDTEFSLVACIPRVLRLQPVLVQHSFTPCRRRILVRNGVRLRNRRNAPALESS